MQTTKTTMYNNYFKLYHVMIALSTALAIILQMNTIIPNRYLLQVTLYTSKHLDAH